jgi:predicted DNA-binding transcriptional regulator AlpA
MTHNDRFIPVTQVANILGIGVSTAWLWRKSKPEFPQAISLSKRCTRWSLSEVNSFANSLKAERNVGSFVGSLA